MTSDKNICQQFQNMFSYCSEPVFINGDLIRKDKYKTNNGCVMIQCNDETETVSAWSLCNRTSKEERICVEEKCINNEEMRVSIRIKLEKAVEVKDIVMEQDISIIEELRGVMKEACGIKDDEEMMIGWQTDEEGRINEFVIYTDDEGVFKNRTKISELIQDQWKSMQYPRAKEIEITRKHVCLKEECKKDIYVEIELDESIEEDELDVDAILEILKDEIGIDISGILIGWDIDKSGRINRVKIHVEDEATARLISSRITDLWPKAKRAEVVGGDNLSCAPMSFVGWMSEIVVILFVLYVAVVDVIP